MPHVQRFRLAVFGPGIPVSPVHIHTGWFGMFVTKRVHNNAAVAPCGLPRCGAAAVVAPWYLGEPGNGEIEPFICRENIISILRIFVPPVLPEWDPPQWIMGGLFSHTVVIYVWFILWNMCIANTRQPSNQPASGGQNVGHPQRWSLLIKRAQRVHIRSTVLQMSSSIGVDWTPVNVSVWMRVS